jgi:hypothetical protein
MEHVRCRGDLEYLQGLREKLKAPFLADLGLSEEEYLSMIKRELEAIIREEG